MPQKQGAEIQKHINIKDIKDGVIILKDRGMRAILLASSINFALKSGEEQDAIIYKYQSFLNSLDFPVQIMVASRKFNIDPYIDTLKTAELKQENELLKIQTTEYINFIQGLTESSNIMTESFYVVIPYAPIQIKAGTFTKLFSKKKEVSQEVNDDEFQKLKTQLWQRVEFVMSGLGGAGIKTVPLNNDELIELFYKLYNPSARENPELEKAKDIRMQ